ncbi:MULTISPECIES: cyclic nucleotide-binding domain-containing protein [Vagococcus]|uniref:Predicted N-ribosylNicotinamide CRP-like regulator n=1 Tax=Vagococcus fluvialis bH819 TaxID=1255619 RepID=A0A1X6WNC8_9ENTE|nr:MULTISPECIES: cyclic nucleotide-binding domain-containing protein [Vagococcus]SLM85780.1 Predicted N-ribosylNicotinamide CRP-like regulator [Vagococcus fluvialis bH819]HCM90202.1 cyclic nucleotide-binding protein [Vagococcus sp.]
MKKILYPLSTINFEQKMAGIDTTILSQSIVFEFKQGEFITRQNEVPAYLYVILSGRAKIMTSQTNGKQLILQFLNEQDLIGDLTIIQAEEETKDVIALGSTVCLGIPMDLVESKLIPNAEFLYFLANYIGKKLLLRVEHFKEQQTQELKIRLIKLLLDITIDDEYHEKHTEIAEYLGVSYRHYMHTLKFLKENDMITKKAACYMINRNNMIIFLNEDKKMS